MDTQILERDGWSIPCPNCSKQICYTLINNQPPVPFFYADDSNDVLLRKSDQDLVDDFYAASKADSSTTSTDQLEELWLDILTSAPATSNGGKYRFWSNVKCNSCNTELPYNNGTKDVGLRITEPKVVLVNGAKLIGDTAKDTWVVKVALKKSE